MKSGYSARDKLIRNCLEQMIAYADREWDRGAEVIAFLEAAHRSYDPLVWRSAIAAAAEYDERLDGELQCERCRALLNDARSMRYRTGSGELKGT